MTKEEIYEFLNNNKVCTLATIDGDKPRVRGMMTFSSDPENGIVFHTGPMKDVYKQLTTNPNVELAFINPESGVQIRVSGVANFDNDIELKKKIVEERDFLKPIIEKFGNDAIAVFKVKNLQAVVWTMQTNLEPKKNIEL